MRPWPRPCLRSSAPAPVSSSCRTCSSASSPSRACCASRDQLKVWSLGDLGSGEPELLARFFDGIEKYLPELVSWNGGGFDLPVLHYRSLRAGVQAPRYWETGDEDNSFRYNNYLSRYHWRHLDLMDVLSGFQPRARAKLNDVAALLGFPGKLGFSGEQVWDAYLAGELPAVRRYCETDVHQYLPDLSALPVPARAPRPRRARGGVRAPACAAARVRRAAPPGIPQSMGAAGLMGVGALNPETGRVVALSHDGEGIVREGKTALVAGALPGEVVRFRRARRHRQYDDARLEAVLEPAPGRVPARCAHFEICGGCALQHLDHQLQIELKQQQLAETLERIGQLTPPRWLDPIRSRPWAYRRRARLGVKYVSKKGRVLVGFRERSSHLIASLDRCEVLAAPVGELITPLAELIGQLSIRQQLPQIEVAVAEQTTALVLRVLASPSAGDAALLHAFELQHGVRFYLQTGGLETVRALGETAPRLSYTLPEAAVELEFRPTDFVQVNAAVNQALVAAAPGLLQLGPEARVLDLYCGLGNFSLPLARRAARVVGVEGDAALVERARANARLNGIDNAEFHCADLSGAPLSDAAWLRDPYTHVLLDPPRVGARELLPRIAQLAPQRLLYVSCHPGTLARDLGELVHQHGFELLAAGVVDMFAHTAHVESLALLQPHGGGHGP